MPAHSENTYKHRADGVTEIHLLHGLLALIDTQDFALVRPHRWFAGKRRSAWYVYTNIKSYTNQCGWKLLGIHRLILRTELHVDHRNGNGLENRRLNLRPANRSQNKFNGKHQAKGVRLVSGLAKPWVAYIGYKGKRLTKSFGTEKEAQDWRSEMVSKYYGDFSREHAG